ncbi:MAG TPA: metal ABC transporter permease [Marinilabiliaceae bacterium]|nr:metal ABC transporter permease [Marinilabiliaceae bacterium]
MSDFFNLFQYQFFQNAVAAVILTSLIAAMIGTYVVARKIVFISGGITHASFGGIGLAYYLGLNPFLGAAVFAVFTGTSIEWMSNRGTVREDSAIAILWSLGMAIGIIFVFLTPGYAPNLMSFLFGSILSVGKMDLAILLGLFMITALFFHFFYRPIVQTAFDPEFAGIMGTKVKLFRYLMSILISLAIVVSIRAMGIILVLSLFTIPQSTALLFASSFKKIIPWSILWAVTGSLIGLFVAYEIDIPSGAAIIFVLTLQYLFIKGLFLLVGWLGLKSSKQLHLSADQKEK